MVYELIHSVKLIIQNILNSVRSSDTTVPNNGMVHLHQFELIQINQNMQHQVEDILI